MASLKIIDLGYLNKTKTGSAVTAVNSGQAIDLTNTASVQLSWKNNVDNDPEPGTNEPTDTNYVSFDNRSYEIDVILFKNNTSDQTILKHICGVYKSSGLDSTYPGLIATQGIKAIYMSATSDGKKTIVELLGDTSTSYHGATSTDIPTGMPCVLGYVQNLSIRDTADGTGLRVHFTFVEA